MEIFVNCHDMNMNNLCKKNIQIQYGGTKQNVMKCTNYNNESINISSTGKCGLNFGACNGDKVCNLNKSLCEQNNTRIIKSAAKKYTCLPTPVTK